MLKERYGFTDDNGNVEVFTVDEILKNYEIKDLKLEELQEKYVNMVDDYDEEINDLEEQILELKHNNEQLNENISDLETSIEELTESIENKTYYNINDNSSLIIFFIIAIIISFFIGKYVDKKEMKK